MTTMNREVQSAAAAAYAELADMKSADGAYYVEWQGERYTTYQLTSAQRRDMTEHALKLGRIALGIPAFRIAMALGKLTQAELRDALEDTPVVYGGKSSKTLGIMQWLRQKADSLRFSRHRGQRPTIANTSCRPAKVWKMPAGTPAQRLGRLRKTIVKATVERTFRTARQGHTTEVNLVDDPREVGFDVDEGKTYPYRGHYKGWSASTSHFTVNVPANWRSRVAFQGLALIGGLMTLDAQRLDSPEDGIDLFAATWAEQSRGFDVNVRHGFIARRSGTDDAFHADTPAKAVSGLKRRLAYHGTKHLSDGTTWKRRVTEANKLKATLGEVPVTLDDSREAGNCDYGTRSWCYRVGIDPDAGSVPLAQVIDGYLSQPLPEAWRVILLVKRHHRQEKAA